MSTRRCEGWVADLGAQFTAAQDPYWRGFLQSLGSQVKEVQTSEDLTYPRYIHRDGMSALARAWISRSDALNDVEFQTRVIRISINSNVWRIQLESGVEWSARAIVLTAPVPQAIELIRNSGLVISENSERRLTSISLSSCLAVVVPWLSRSAVSIPAIWKSPSPQISGIYQQVAKGIQMDPSIHEVSVIHASPSLSRELWEREHSDQISEILKEADRLIGAQGGLFDSKKAMLHRWRYCEPLQNDPELFFKVEFSYSSTESPLLVLAGDAFGRSSIEGALISGRSAGERLLEMTKF